MEAIGVKEFYNSAAIEFRHELGNFNIVTVDNLSSCTVQPIPYTRRNFYKINLMKGIYNIHYSDKTYTIQKQGILFASPKIPYNWIPQEGDHSGVYCIFTPEFFHQFGDIAAYEVFHTEGAHVLELNDLQFEELSKVFTRMQKEFDGDYVHKFDLIRNLVFEVLHYSTRLIPHKTKQTIHNPSSRRVTDDFLNILERQFPIVTMHQQLQMLTPGDFADKLAIHVNYLNRTLRKTMGESTSKIIQGRIMREAKILLKHSELNISEISFLLGFKEPTHFANAFKKQEGLTPSQYRKV